VPDRRLATSLVLREDIVLSNVISTVIDTARHDYSHYQVSHFGSILTKDDKAWQSAKSFGLEPPIARLQECVADNRVKEKRLARQSVKPSRVESDEVSRSGDPSDGRPTGEVPPIGSPGSMGVQVPRPRTTMEVPREAYPPELPPIGEIPEPELSFLLVWPESDDEFWGDDKEMTAPPESKCPDASAGYWGIE
jgi:hypothetical protein